MHRGKIAVSFVSCILAFNIFTVNTYASNINWVSDITNEQSVSKVKAEESLNSIEDISTQVEGLYNTIAENTGLDAKYIRQLHVLAGGKAIYKDKKANRMGRIGQKTYLDRNCI